MRYWRFMIGFAFLFVAMEIDLGPRTYIALAGAVLCLVWGFAHNIKYKKKRAKWLAEHPYYDPNYEYSRFQVENTDVTDEEGDRQAALRRFMARSDEFEGEILGSLRPQAQDEEGRATAYGVYLNETRVGDVPASEVEFISERLRHLETFNKIMLTNWEEGSEGPLGLLVSLRFPRNKYDAPYNIRDGAMLGNPGSKLIN
ncbi:MAG: hypothetical protein IKD93_02150 [Firmicutes bacterium]|nr:hypothetical protein [Bacillota bacterium]